MDTTHHKTMPRVVAVDRDHLKELVTQCMEHHSCACDLNHIDVSRVTSMRYLFEYTFFTGDISQWDVSNVTDMQDMFHGCPFNGDIARWDTSSVRTMKRMFCGSSFCGTIAQWNTVRVESMKSMFKDSPFNGDIGTWNVAACQDFGSMFYGSVFNQDVGAWNMRSAQDVQHMFNTSPFAHDVSMWHLPLECETYGLFGNYSVGSVVQRPALWHAKLHLDNGTRPPPGPMLDAFDALRSIHDAMGSTNAERARDMVRVLVPKMEGKGAGPAEGESWALPELD